MDNLTNFSWKIGTNSLVFSIIRHKRVKWFYDYNSKSGTEQGPHTLYLKKYGKSFQTVAKEFGSSVTETAQLSSNTFSTLTESGASALEHIEYLKY